MTEPRFTALLLTISAKTSLSRQVQTETLKSMTSAPFQRKYVPLHPWSDLLTAKKLERKVGAQGTAFHDLTGHSLPAGLGLNGLTLHHHKPFANKPAN